MTKLRVRSLTKLVKAVQALELPRAERSQRKRQYDLFARPYVFIAQLYDFMNLLSGA
jgi:hypothetical protein